MTGLAIFYGGVNAFYPQPTPYIGLDYANVYYGELWAKQETFSLEGVVTGCNNAMILAAQDNLISNFHRSYQTLEIHEQDSGYSGVVYRKELAEIDSIDFSSASWIGVLPYTIKLRCYPSGYFSGAYGILDPKDAWNFQENENRTATVTHAISCRGLNTSSSINNALTNAANWAATRRNTTGIPSAALIQNVSPNNFCLLTSSENIDRFNGTYSITDTYTNDLARSGYGILRYSAVLESGNNAITVNLQGTVQGCNRDIDSVRATFATFNPTGAAVFLYSGTFGYTDLNPVYLSRSISEDPYNAIIAFNYQFDNYNGPDTYFDYSVSLTSGANITASIQGEVISRGGDLKASIAKEKAYAESLDLYALTAPFYNSFYPYAASFPLNPHPVSSGITINESQGTVQVNAEFTDQKFYSPIIDYCEVSLDFTPAVQKLDCQPQLDGQGKYILVDLGYANRAGLTVRGLARVNISYSIDQGIAAVKQIAQQNFAQYGRGTNATLDQSNISFDRTDRRIITFSYHWSFESAKIANSPYFTLANFGV